MYPQLVEHSALQTYKQARCLFSRRATSFPTFGICFQPLSEEQHIASSPVVAVLGRQEQTISNYCLAGTLQGPRAIVPAALDAGEHGRKDAL